jgi:hypothetical protein
MNNFKLLKQTSPSNKKMSFGCLNLVKVMIRVHGKRFLRVSFLRFMSDLITFTNPILLNLMILFIKNTQEPKWHGIYLFYS